MPKKLLTPSEIAEAKLLAFRSEVYGWLVRNETDLTEEQIVQLKDIIGVAWEKLRPTKTNFWFEARVVLCKIGYEIDFYRGARKLGMVCRDYGEDLKDCVQSGVQLMNEMGELIHGLDERQPRAKKKRRK